MLLPFIIQNLPALAAPPPASVSIFADEFVASAAEDFGTDLDVVEDIPLNDRLVGGLKNLGNALTRRLITPRGTLPYDLGYGTDIREFLNEGVARGDISDLVSAIQQELESDERVLRANVTNIDHSPATASLTVTVNIDTELGPFSLVLTIGAVTAALLKVE